MQKLFITSSGTGIGKTLVTTVLTWQLRQAGRKVCALKPVISGYDPTDPTNDSALILQACGLEPVPEYVEAISPWRYAAPLAPNMAAAQEGNRRVDVKALADFCIGQSQEDYDALIVEGVGGIMAPLSDKHTVLEWMQMLGWPAVLVAGSYLGAISHALSAAEVLIARGIVIRGVVVSESADSGVSLDDTVSTLEKFLPQAIPVLAVPRIHGDGALWERAVQLSRLYDV